MIITVLKYKQCLLSTPGFDHDMLEIHLRIQGLVELLMAETAVLAFVDSDNKSIQK